MGLYITPDVTATDYIPPITVNEYGGSGFTIPDTAALLQQTRLTLTGGKRLTLSGTGRLTVYDPLDVLELKGAYNVGAFSLRSGEFLLQYGRLTLTGNQRMTLTEDARVVLFGFGPVSRIVLAGGAT
jgi:hypothetical protein